MVVELRPHQKKAVNGLANGKVLVGGVGTGKTITSLVYFFTKVLGGVVGDFGSIQHPMDLYVFTTARKRDSLDWQKDAISLGISTNRDASVGRVRLVVDSYNNIDKYKDIKNAFIILDEQRMVGSGSWSRTFIRLAKNNLWIMLSATPGDKWEDYIPLFVANGFYKNRSEFKRDHCVYSYYGRFPKLERYLGVGKLVRLRNQILVDMPYERHTTRHIYEVPVDYDVDLFNKVVKQRWHVYEDRPLKDVSELFSVMRKVVNSDTSRLSAVRGIMKEHPRLIVFYNFDYELEMLRTLADTKSSPQTTVSPTSIVSDVTRLGSNSGTITNMTTTAKPGEESLLLTSSTQKTSKSSLLNQTTTSKLTNGSTNKSTPFEKQKKIDTEICSLTRASLLEQISTDGSKTILKSISPIGNSKSQNEHLKSDCPSEEDLESLAWMMEMEESLQTQATRKSEKPWQSTEGGITSVPSKEDRFTTSTGIEAVVFAEWNGHKHEPIPTSDRWVYLVQYVAGAEAWNCIETNTVVFYSLTYSYKNFEQAKGRIDRLDTPFLKLNYFVLISKSLIDRAVSKSLKGKKSFNERDLAFNG